LSAYDKSDYSFPTHEKKRVAYKTIKRYNKFKAPYQRIIESKDVLPAQKKALKEQFVGLNPFK